MRIKTLALAIAGVATLSGCLVRNEAVAGSLYLDVAQPMMVTDNGAMSSKRGESSASSILGWIGMGDCSVGAAAKSAGINKITAVDYHSMQILGLFGTTKTIVYGE